MTTLLTGFIMFTTPDGTVAGTCAIEPDFDCSMAKNTVEQLICNNNELAELDNLLAVAYQTALYNFPDDEKKALKANQNSWRDNRNACQTADNVQVCIRHAYQTRITELQIQSGEFEVTKVSSYQFSVGSTVPHAARV